MSMKHTRELVFLICFSISCVHVYDKLAWAADMETRRIYGQLEHALKLAGQITEWSEYHKQNVCEVLRFVETEYGLRPEKVLAVWMHESRFKPDATGRNLDGSIDMGIGQINSTSYRHILAAVLTVCQERGKEKYIELLEKNSPYNPSTCAVLSAIHLGRLYKAHTNYSKALNVYNSGGLRNWQAGYIKKVKGALAWL